MDQWRLEAIQSCVTPIEWPCELCRSPACTRTHARGRCQGGDALRSALTLARIHWVMESSCHCGPMQRKDAAVVIHATRTRLNAASGDEACLGEKRRAVHWCSFARCYARLLVESWPHPNKLTGGDSAGDGLTHRPRSSGRKFRQRHVLGTHVYRVLRHWVGRAAARGANGRTPCSSLPVGCKTSPRRRAAKLRRETVRRAERGAEAPAALLAQRHCCAHHRSIVLKDGKR